MKLRIALMVTVVPVALGAVAAPAMALRAIPSYTPVTLNSPIPEAGAGFGDRMDAVGDVDGDGVNDVAVSSPRASFRAQQHVGRVWVFSGRTRTLLFSMFPPGADRQTDDGFGSSVIGVGDVNGDGVPDMAIGSSSLDLNPRVADPGGNFAPCTAGTPGCNEDQGRVYIYSGKGDLDFDPSRGLVIRVVDAPTPQAFAYFGDDQAVGTGDLNGDMVNDFVESESGENVGLCDADFDPATAVEPCPVGAAYTISGATGRRIHRLDDPDPQPYDSFASGGVSDPGDVTGDRVDDVTMGAPFSDAGGHLYLFDGRAGGPAKLAISDREDPTAGFGFGRGTGREPRDANGDGVGDLYAVDPGQKVGAVANAGRAYLLSGVNGSLVRTLDDPNPKPSGSFGFYHASAGDLNDDGMPDVLAMRFSFTQNAYAPDPPPGAAAYVVDGRSGAGLVTLPGVTSDGPALSLASPGDLNGDGYPDYLLGGRVSDGSAGDLTGRVLVELSGPPSSTPPAATPPATAILGATTTPVLSGLSLSPRTLRAALSGASAATALGSRVSYSLSENASVRFGVERARGGRRVLGHCIEPTHSNRGAPRCARYVAVRGSFTRAARMGSNAFRFRGRIGGRTLPAGRYRLSATATNPSGNRSEPRRSPFRIVGS